MTKFLLLSVLIFMASCAGCGKEEEDFTPYPGGKGNERTMPTK